MKAHRLLNIDRGDYPKLGVLAPTFAIMAASTVILASLSKALFLASNPITLLPWMFLGSAASTVITSLGYVSLMRVMALGARFTMLLVVAALTLVALRVAYPTHPAALGIAILLWCPVVGHVLVVQTWNLAVSLLPMRQGKRLFPVLAAVTTLGAVVGGLLVQLMLRWVGAEDLLLVATGLLLVPLVTIRSVIRKLDSSASAKDVREEKPEPETTEEKPRSEVAQGFRSIFKQPLLAELAMLSFLLQAASLVLDYQFSAEIQPQFGKDGIASFLGTFYWSSNLVVLLLTLLATSRFVRLVGIGVALAASAIVVGVGSSLYVVAATTGMLSMFWVIAATAFAERVAEYAFTKPAIQMVYMPLQTQGGARAKTIIDGVFHRVATAVVSVALLLLAPSLSSQFRLSPPAIVACVLVLYLGVRLGPHYRKALFDALRARRLDNTIAAYLRDGLGANASGRLVTMLKSGDARRRLRALEVANELAMPLPRELLANVVLDDDETVAGAALRALFAAEETPPPAIVARVLSPERPARLLRASLQVLAELASTEQVEAFVRPLTQHHDPAVVAAACVFRVRVVGGMQGFADVRIGVLDSGNADAMGHQFTGITRARQLADELPELLGSDEREVRAEAIAQMGELGLPSFIDPLVVCLERVDARSASSAALRRFGPRALPALVARMQDDELSRGARVALVRIIEGIGTDRAVDAFVAMCRFQDEAMKGHAVEALWRMAADEAAPRPSNETLLELLGVEVARLRVYSAIEVMITGSITGRHRMFASELVAQQTSTERRIFRLLALRYDREAMQKAFLHYQSTEQRVRSNAIELLEQHLADASLRPFVALIERQEGAKGELRPRSLLVQSLIQDNDINSLLSKDDWLQRLWQWSSEHDTNAPLDWDHPLDRVMEIKRLPLFAEISCHNLMPVAEKLNKLAFAAGDTIFNRGEESRDLFWLLDGDVVLSSRRRADERVRQLSCFGVVSALDGGPRSATAAAASDALALRLSHEDLEDAIELNPHILTGLIEHLSGRLRAMSDSATFEDERP